MKNLGNSLHKNNACSGPSPVAQAVAQAVAQVEWLVHERGLGFNPRPIQSTCTTVFDQDTEPQNAPNGRISPLRGSVHFITLVCFVITTHFCFSTDFTLLFFLVMSSKCWLLIHRFSKAAAERSSCTGRSYAISRRSMQTLVTEAFHPAGDDMVSYHCIGTSTA